MRKKNFLTDANLSPDNPIAPEVEASVSTLKAIGDRMKLARKSLSLTQAAISDLFGCSLRTYQKNEAGISEGGILLILAFTGIGINANWLMTGTGDMSRTPKPSQVEEEQSAYEAQDKSLTVGQMELMRTAIEAIEEGLQTTEDSMTPEKKAALILTVYDLLNKEPASKEAVLRLARFAV